MFKSVQTKVNVVKAMKDYRVAGMPNKVSNDKFIIPKDELPVGIMQMDGKLKRCK